MKERHNNRVYVKGLASNEFDVDYYKKLEKIIKLQYHTKQNKVFLFKCYLYDTTNRGIRENPYHDLAKINIKARLCNIDDVFVFIK